jgi:DNA-binding LacI/PurR family transcriptional regulator
MDQQRHLLYERLYNFVLDDIRKGALRSGDRVPSEKELARKHGVSRITSMRALQNLERAGVVERIRGKGTFVAGDLAGLPELRVPSPGRPARSRRLTSRIAFLLPDASPAYGLELMNAVEERAAEKGLGLVLKRSRGEQEEEERAIETLTRTASVDGVIVFPVNGEFYNASLLRLVLAKSPVVLVDRYLKGINASTVHTDNQAAARELTGYVLDRGYKHVAFVSSPPANTSSIEDRLHGFRAAFSQRGIGHDRQHLLTNLTSGFPNPESKIPADREAIKVFVLGNSSITGFVASEYPIALIVHDVLGELGRLDGAMVTCFDSPRGQFVEPRFTHIQQDEREMGRRAVDLLLAQLDGHPTPSQSIVPHRLVKID